MAYDFFPKTSKQIMDKLGGKFPAENVAELIILHERLSKEYGLETPINIDGDVSNRGLSNYRSATA